MTDKKSNESRRKLLKSVAAGSGAIVASKSLPESWSRPVVDSVMLPAHAQTSPSSPPSPPSPLGCSPDPQTVVDSGTGTSTDAIAIIFDGQTTCTLQIGDVPSDIPDPNLVVMVDTDFGNTDVWTIYTDTRNWTRTSASFDLGGGPNSFGSHWLIFNGGGNQYRADFTLSRPDGSTLIMSGVSIVPN